MKKYFSNVLIGQYFVTRIPVKVYVDNEYLRIVEFEDIEDPYYGYGMRTTGEMVPFDYRMVDHLLVGTNIIDLDTATKKSDDGEEKEADTEKGAEKEEGGEEETGGEKETEEK